MGRTLPTVTQLIHMQEDEWKNFRRTLRKADQDAYDMVWRLARHHAAPISMASRPVPMEAMFMAMVVGLARRVLDLEAGQGKSNGQIQRLDI